MLPKTFIRLRSRQRRALPSVGRPSCHDGMEECEKVLASADVRRRGKTQKDVLADNPPRFVLLRKTVGGIIRKYHGLCPWGSIFIILLLGIAINAYADVVIKVRAINPLDTEIVAPIKYPLPEALRPEDIISKSDDFKIRYDKENGYYYIDHEVVLAPKQIVTLSVNVKDVWFIPPGKIEKLKTEIDTLLSRQGAEIQTQDTATSLVEEIYGQLDKIIERQGQNTAAKVGVEKHIKVYEENIEMLSQAEKDIAMLKSLLKEKKKAKKK